MVQFVDIEGIRVISKDNLRDLRTRFAAVIGVLVLFLIIGKSTSAALAILGAREVGGRK